MKNYLKAICLALAVGLAGCISQEFGTKIDPAKVSQIKKGVSTRADVEALLGTPLNVAMAGDGKRIMFYTYTATSGKTKATTLIPVVGMVAGGGTGETTTQTLQVSLNAAGIVEDFEFSDKATKFETNAWGTNIKTTPVAPTAAASEKK